MYHCLHFKKYHIRINFGKLLLHPQNTLKARVYGHGFSGKARCSGQICYDGTTVFSNSGNFNISDTLGSVGVCSNSFNF